MTPPAFARMSGTDEDAALGEDRVGLEIGRAVRALHQQRHCSALGVVRGDLVLDRGGDQHVAGQLEQLGVA